MLLLIMALMEEAGPIIRHYQLKLLQDKKFKIFKNGDIVLIISGIYRSANYVIFINYEDFEPPHV